jgi:DNA-binding NarL/FixJ family response regulator
VDAPVVGGAGGEAELGDDVADVCLDRVRGKVKPFGDAAVGEALASQLLDRAREASPLDQLTTREREVLALMAEGLTDRGIAERLYLTPNTIETHVRHIIAKLGLPASPADNRRVHAVLTYLRHD